MDAKGRFEERDAAREGAWKVGELAEKTGLSVRALHHYEEVGLLVPSGRAGTRGDRLYAEGDVLRLQQIASLRSLGFSLGEVRECLDDPGFSPLRVIGLHVARLKERIELEKRLCERLEAVAARLGDRAEGSTAEVSAEGFVEAVMEVTRMSEMAERYYTPEQREALERRRQDLGEERIREVAAEWPGLMERVRAEMDAGTDPADERAQELARRWKGLVREMTGGDASIQRSMSNMWWQEETVGDMDAGPMREMIEYVSRAWAASGGGGGK
jgi:DNA-binding transcriptional MerR regulator